MPAHTLSRNEMLKSKIQINRLFERGIRLNKYPLKVILLPISESEQKEPCLFMVMVSAKKFKRAVDRNRIKRIIKEAYRQNKSLFYSYLTENNKKCLLGIMYYGNAIPTFEKIETALIIVLKRIPETYAKYSEESSERI